MSFWNRFFGGESGLSYTPPTENLPPPLPVVEPRCFVKSILDDLKRLDEWSFEYKHDWLAKCKDKPYTLYVHHRYGEQPPYVSLLDASDIEFTKHERDLLEKAVKLVWENHCCTQKKIREEKNEKTLEKLFPQCYPKSGGVEMMN